MSNDKAAVCHICGRAVWLKANGRFRRHTDIRPDHNYECAGGDKRPGQALSAGDKARI